MAKSLSPSTSAPVRTQHGSRPVVAGIVTALVGFTSSFAVVLAGLRAVGADPAQAASGLLALTLAVGLGVLLLAWRSKVPVTLAWSTPGAALLAASGAADGGWPAAVGAFLAAGVLIALTGLVPALGRLMARIPTSLAQAMLAGVLLQLCLAPFKALGSVPLLAAPVIICWLLLMKFAPRWAVPAALLVALGVIGIPLASAGSVPDTEGLVPALVWTTPSFSLQAMAGIALPLFVVTMASQNVPGVAVLHSFGFKTPWRSSMLVTGPGRCWPLHSGAMPSTLRRSALPSPQATRPGMRAAGAGLPVSRPDWATWCWLLSRQHWCQWSMRPRRGCWRRWPAWPCWAPSLPPHRLPWQTRKTGLPRP